MKRTVLFFLLTFSQFSFSQLNGPDAPDVTLDYSMGEFTFEFSNPVTSNNYMESYLEYDPSIDSTLYDPFWRFQGYAIFQLANSSVNVLETLDTNYARLALLVDVNDSLSSFDWLMPGCTPIAVNTMNTGISPTVSVSVDPFTQMGFVDNQEYCFRVFAVASNPNAMDANCNLPNHLLNGYTTGNGVGIPSYCLLASETAGLDQVEEMDLKIYPNPSADEVFIDWSNHGKDVSVRVFNELGQIVLEETPTEESLRLTLPQAGVYIIEVRSDGLVAFEKVVRY